MAREVLKGRRFDSEAILMQLRCDLDAVPKRSRYDFEAISVSKIDSEDELTLLSFTIALLGRLISLIGMSSFSTS